MNIAMVLSGTDVERARLAKVTDGAHQFEAMMIGQMLKGMKFGTAPGDAEENSQAEGNAMQEFGVEALAKTISAGGGFGIARQIARQVLAEEQAKSSPGAA